MKGLFKAAGIGQETGMEGLDGKVALDRLKGKLAAVPKAGKAALVIVSETASENTKKKFQNMCTYYEVPLYFFGEKETLGHAMGKEFRASLSVEDAGFAKSMAALMNINGGSVNESK